MCCTATKPIDWTKPIETTCGKPARVLCTDRKNAEFPILLLVTELDGKELCRTCSRDGGGDWSGTRYRNVRKELKRAIYVNVYPDDMADRGVGVYGGHSTRKQADSAASGYRVACVKVPVTCYEGQFDE
jgi:hypothetical protein